VRWSLNYSLVLVYYPGMSRKARPEVLLSEGKGLTILPTNILGSLPVGGLPSVGSVLPERFTSTSGVVPGQSILPERFTGVSQLAPGQSLLPPEYQSVSSAKLR
jgi:hypothetical protein